MTVYFKDVKYYHSQDGAKPFGSVLNMNVCYDVEEVKEIGDNMVVIRDKAGSHIIASAKDYQWTN